MVAVVTKALVISALVPAAPWTAAPASADDTAVGGVGDSLYPPCNSPIRLDQATVQGVVYRDFAEYMVEFHFVNDGPAQDVMLGLPFAVTADHGSGHTTGPVSAFQGWQDGRPLKVTMGRSLPQSTDTAEQVG